PGWRARVASSSEKLQPGSTPYCWPTGTDGVSGILGIWNLDDRPLDQDVLARSSDTLAHRGPDGCDIWIDGPLGLAYQMLRVTPESLTDRQPLVTTQGSEIVFDGRLDNRDELVTMLRADRSVSFDCPDSILVGAAY